MGLKQNLKEKYGVDINSVVDRFNEKKEAFKSIEKFDYDPSALPAYKDNTMPDMITDLISNSEFLSDLTVEEGIKGTREIALLNADITLQAKSGCTTSPDGSVIFTKKDLTVHLLQAGIEFCNETLNTKMTQILNAIGVKRQNGQLPADLEDILMVYLTKLLAKKAQRVVLLGDTTSLDDELALFDGLVKLIDADGTVATFTSTDTSINDTNGYDLAKGLYKAINSEVMDAEMPVTIYTGRDAALSILEQWNTDKPYNQIDVPNAGGSMSFKLPLYGITVKTTPELNETANKKKMFAIPTSLAFLGTDQLSDMDLEIKYDDYNDKLKAEASFRLGTNFVWGKYFTKLVLA